MRDIIDHRYRIEQKLAVGGFGTIYRATDTAIGRQVALKILHRELAGDPNVVARFRRETAALAKLKSSHTLTLYDVGTVDDTLYFVMELLRGESLHEVFHRTGPLPWSRIARIARGVCASLREAHALGIVHRDLKPANIFLETHALDVDHVKVLDFGIAKIVAASADLENRDLTRHGQMIGTFDYMAPEQMVGGACTNKSDLFTLGVVMYEMLTGVRPYGDANGPAQMLMALMTTTPTPLTGVPSELARIVMKCLAREPQDRPDVEQLDQVLEALLGSEDATFSDTEETLVSARAPRPRAVTAQGPSVPAPLRPASRPPARGSVAAISMRDESRQSMPSIMVSHEALTPVPSSVPPVAPSRTPQGTPLAGVPQAQAALAHPPVASPTHPTMFDARVAAQVALAQTLDIRPAAPTAPAVLARGSDVTMSPPMRSAHADIGVRTSEAQIARDIELALAATVATEPISDDEANARASLTRVPRPDDVAVRFMTPAEPIPAAPKGRMASGTSPVARPGSAGPRSGAEGDAESIENEAQAEASVDLALAQRAITLLPPAPESTAVAFVRYSIIALCLFGLGFLGALALWSL